jgi:hypothetical protein
MLLALAMIFTTPMPLAAAVDRLESKTPIAADLTSDQWAQIELGLSDRAFFSSRVNDIGVVTEMQSRIDDALSLARRDGGAFMDRSRFIADLRGILGAEPGDSGDLTDITSSARLGLIYDFNTEDAMEYGRWVARQNPAILDAFPCNELVRVEAREVPRGYRRGAKGRLVEVPEESWPARWDRAGGDFVGGRMIALKNDPIWIRISRFGRPWPPFDFNSGMGLADVSRDEAEQLGVIQPHDLVPKPMQMDFNHNLQASIPDATPAVMESMKRIFGDQVAVAKDGTVAWQGQQLAALYKRALGGQEADWTLDLGEATPEAIEAGGDDLADSRLQLTADDLRTSGALSVLDAQLIPHIWRDPDQVETGPAGELVFTKSFLGRKATATFDQVDGALTLASLTIDQEDTP